MVENFEIIKIFETQKSTIIKIKITMKILVCISHVPDTTSKINFADNDTKFDTNGVNFVINPNDEFGLTRAMWFKEKQFEFVIVRLTIPINAFPGPISIKFLTPAYSMFIKLSRHLTVE